MNHLLLRLGFAATLLLAAGARAETWTLSDAVKTALERSPDARTATHRVEAAQALVQQAGAAWRPQVSLQGRYTATNGAMPAFGSILNQRAFLPSIDFNRPGTVDNLNATGTVAYNLYSGGRATAGRTAAQAGAAAAESDLRAAQHQLAAAVVRAALEVHKSRAGVEAVAGTVRAFEAALAVAQVRFDAGQMLKADLLGLSVQLAQTRETLSSARHATALAAHALRVVIGLEPGNEPLEVVIDGTLQGLPQPPSADFSGRAELRAATHRVRAAEAQVEAARSGRRAHVNAFAGYQYDQGWKTDRHGDSWLAGVAVDLAVFDGGQTSGRIRQATAELAQAREMQRKAELNIRFEVDQAQLAHRSALERLDVSARSVEQAEEGAALSRVRFERQTLTLADVIGAETRLLEARVRRTLAESDERLALVELRRALGLDPFPRP